VNLQELLSAHKSHVRETSLFAGAMSNQVRNRHDFRFARKKRAKRTG